MTPSPIAPLLETAFAHVNALQAQAQAQQEALQQEEHARRAEVKAEILRDLKPRYPQLAAYGEYVELDRLSSEGATYANGASLLVRLPECDLIFLCVRRFTQNTPWQTIPGKEDPFKVYPYSDSAEWWDASYTSHRDLLPAIADAHQRYQRTQTELAKVAAVREQEALDQALEPTIQEIGTAYFATLHALACAGHPVPLSTDLPTHIKGLLRRLSQYELLLIQGKPS